ELANGTPIDERKLPSTPQPIYTPSGAGPREKHVRSYGQNVQPGNSSREWSHDNAVVETHLFILQGQAPSPGRLVFGGSRPPRGSDRRRGDDDTRLAVSQRSASQRQSVADHRWQPITSAPITRGVLRNARRVLGAFPTEPHSRKSVLLSGSRF